jgi:hypothetical protein
MTDKWLYALKHLPDLLERPNIAEITGLSEEEIEAL